MAADDVPLDDKAKRMRDLLSSFYSPDPSMSSNSSSKLTSFDAINTASFDADQYMNLVVRCLSASFAAALMSVVDKSCQVSVQLLKVLSISPE